jgi:hypothetical protein
VFTLEHQDGDIKYELEKGGFAIVDSKLYVSIETKAIDDEAFPELYLFAIDGYPVNNGLESSIISVAANPKDTSPNVFVYTAFHACEVEAIVDLKVISDNEIKVVLNVISEDVNYYNEKAKPNPFKGEVKLLRRNLGEMWIPS